MFILFLFYFSFIKKQIKSLYFFFVKNNSKLIIQKQESVIKVITEVHYYNQLLKIY